jgi:hypothetical protein
LAAPWGAGAAENELHDRVLQCLEGGPEGLGTRGGAGEKRRREMERKEKDMGCGPSKRMGQKQTRGTRSSGEPRHQREDRLRHLTSSMAACLRASCAALATDP